MLSTIFKLLCDNSVPESNALILGELKLDSFVDKTWNKSKSDFMFNLQNCKNLCFKSFDTKE